LKAYGTDRLGEVISGSCSLAQYLKRRIESEHKLEILAPVSLNIVCFGYRCDNPDTINRNLAIALQESGIAAPSTTVVNGRIAIRVALFNHRTLTRDIDTLIEATLELGAALSAQHAAAA
jgi:aromatic-L-amino-acid decarboxylase